MAAGWESMTDATARHGKFKQRAAAELRLFLIIALYLAVLLGAFTLYRRLTYAELGIGYLAYGFKLVEALVIAKIILLGEAIGLGRGSEHRPLAAAVAVKTILFTILIVAFTILEHTVEALVHGEPWARAVMSFSATGIYEMLARTLVLVIALVPFFAVLELSRALGPGRLAGLFFSRPADRT
jgi:hypothetical protein